MTYDCGGEIDVDHDTTEKKDKITPEPGQINQSLYEKQTSGS